MTYENLKNIIDEKINSECKCLSAFDLYMLAVSSLTSIHKVLSDDLFISSMNYLHGYGKRNLKKISKIDGKKSPFIAGVQYFTGTREEDNRMLFLLISEYKNIDRRTVLEVFTKNNELNYKLHFDHVEDKDKDSHIVKYSKTFLKSFKNELLERLDDIKTISEIYDVTLNGFDVHAADKYQVINDGLFKVTFETTANETDLHVDIGFNDSQLNSLSNTSWLSKCTLSNYIKENKMKILSKIKVNEEELNNFYKNLCSMRRKQSIEPTLKLHK